MKEHAEQAAKALSDLNVLAGIVGLLEARALSNEAQKVEMKIISICKAEGMRRYQHYEQHLSAI